MNICLIIFSLLSKRLIYNHSPTIAPFCIYTGILLVNYTQLCYLNVFEVCQYKIVVVGLRTCNTHYSRTRNFVTHLAARSVYDIAASVDDAIYWRDGWPSLWHPPQDYSFGTAFL
jgi:hypothetical protein